VAIVLLLESVTISPALPAGPLSVTVPVEVVPSRTTVGFNAIEVSVAMLIVRIADNVAPPSLAEIVAATELETPIVVIVNVPDVDPAAIVTEPGTPAAVLLDDKVTTNPPVGAGPFSVAVPVEDVPPTTELGETVTLKSPGGVIVSVAL
jgi:hypothetical protein